MSRATHPLMLKLDEIRVARGLSGSEMARRLGVAPSSWTRMVKGGMQPNIDLIPVAAREFPEVRFFVVERLLIGTDKIADTHSSVAPVAAAS